MHPRAEELVARLGLAPHPEGGFYREVHRSEARVAPRDGRPGRSALTVIHFLLTEERGSRLHRVASDEIWHWIEGAPVELVVADGADGGAGVAEHATRAPADARALRRVRLGLFADGHEPVHVVPAGAWQAARSLGPFALVACAVAPGFDFADFTLLDDVPAERAALLARWPELVEQA